jgi:group I intron endonuclease
MAIGVYKITNIINNKCYIGSSRRLHERKNEHNYNLRKNNRSNSIIKNAVLKYGIDNFKFETLEEFVFDTFASSKYIDELITSREQYYVDIIDPEYNIKKKDVTSSKNINCHNRKIIKDKLSIRETNRLFPKNYGRKQIDVYKRENLEFIETVNGVRVCSMKYNVDTSTILHTCKNGYTKSFLNDFLFCYHGDDITKLKREHKHFSFLRKDAISIIQVDKNSNFIKEWRTGSDAEKELGLYKGSVSRVVSGEYSHTKNYYFINKNKNYEYKSRKIICPLH